MLGSTRRRTRQALGLGGAATLAGWMFGIILVESPGGLPRVDHEVYTDEPAGEEDHHKFDMESMVSEEPAYVLMNGEKYALTPKTYGPAATAGTDETVRVLSWTGAEPGQQLPPDRERPGDALPRGLFEH